jgi:hypothetical protein
LDIQKILSDLQREKTQLDRAIAALEGLEARSSARTGMAGKAPAGGQRKKRGRMSAEGRRRLSEAMKKRWAERRKKG